MLDSRKAGAHPLSAAWSKIVDKKALEACSPEMVFDTVDAFGKWLDDFIK